MKHSPTASRNRFSMIKAGVDDIGVKDTQRTPTILEELIGGIVRSIGFAVLEAFSSGFYLIFCDSSQEEKGDHLTGLGQVHLQSAVLHTNHGVLQL